MSLEEILSDSTNTITTLLEKYKGSEYMIQRIKTHINNYLPNTLENELKNYEERVNRNTYLTNEQQLFIQIFLNKNKYFYLPNNNLFYEYNGETYLIIKEDDIIHKLLSSISKERVLLQWKHKTKSNIIKQIKERNLFNSIPETDTIQNVLNVLYPSFFSFKNAAKYFLTIIGDNILKKNTNLIFLVTPQMKQFLNEIDNVALLSIGNNNTTHNFMTKYHENHPYTCCRLIKINNNFSNEVWRELLKKIGLDLLCVAAHYSKRYENSDKFIENKSDEELKSYSYYLKNSTQNIIVEEFSSKYIITTNDCKIEWKNLHFVWKQFLSTSYLPNIIYSNSLKNLLREKYNYDEASDCFIGITSKYLPAHIDFIKFWENTICKDNIELFDNEFEVDELSSLFKLWTKQEKNEQFLTNGQISEENIVKILKHFLPDIEIIEDKYILNISSSMWNKIKDIETFFIYMKELLVKSEENLPLISFDDAYNYYYKFCNMNSVKLVVSKRYFEKYLYYKLPQHIVYEKFIETAWFYNC
jgi:hypothetical protein